MTLLTGTMAVFPPRFWPPNKRPYARHTHFPPPAPNRRSVQLSSSWLDPYYIRDPGAIPRHDPPYLQVPHGPHSVRLGHNRRRGRPDAQRQVLSVLPRAATRPVPMARIAPGGCSWLGRGLRLAQRFVADQGNHMAASRVDGRYEDAEEEPGVRGPQEAP